MAWSIGEGAKSLVRTTAQDGYESQVPLQAPLNVSTVNEDIQDMGTVAPHLLNNGICKDGGVSSLYETDITQTILNDPFAVTAVYPVSNGKLIKIDVEGNVYVNDGIEDIYVGQGANTYFRRQIVHKNYLDVAISSDGIHGLGLYQTMDGLFLDEFSLETLAVTQGPAVINGSGGVTAATIVRANILTFASVQATSGVIYGIAGQSTYYQFGLAASNYSTGVAADEVPERMDSLYAYYNGGTVLFLAPAGGTGTLYYGASPWTSWTALTASGLQTNGIASLAPSATQILGSTQTSVILVACQVGSGTAPTMEITISSGGAVSVGSDAGHGYPTDLTSLFSSVTSGIACPWGSSGRYFDGTHYGEWSGVSPVVAQGTSDNATAPLPELLCQVPMTFITTHGITTYIELKSYKGIAAIVSAFQPTTFNQGTMGTGVPVNDFGGGTFDTDIASNLPTLGTSGTLSQANAFWPFDIRSETVANGGAFVIYRTNNRQYVICQFTCNANVLFSEIGPGVVLINSCCSLNSIIDTNTYTGYENLSGYVNAFILPFASGQSGYFKAFNKYSSSLDPGFLNIDTGAMDAILPVSPGGVSWPSPQYVYTASGFSGWDASGCYVGTVGAVTYSGVTSIVYNNPQHTGTYVANVYLPPAADGIWSKGQAGVQMLFSSAVPQPNFVGYQLANIFPIRYEAFFLLKGLYYAFDGNQIWQIPLSNGPASSVAGPNYPLVAATGLTYLDVSQDYAFFLSSFDNSVWAFDGGRSIEKMVAFNQKASIQSGLFNEVEDRLSLVTSDSVLSMWQDGTITENTLPFTGTFQTYSFASGTIFVQGNVTKQRTYQNIVPGTSTVIPLDFQSAYLGNGSDGQTITVNRVLVRVLYSSGTASALTITWHWLTPDAEGSNVYTITPTLSAAGYGVFDLNPANNEVLGGSVEISTADTTQKITILDVVLYYTGSAEATASNHAS